MNNEKIRNLKTHAANIRKGIIEGTYAAGSGHPGGSLSCADIMAYLYFEAMNVDVANPKMLERDRFVMSKGHCAPALYAALAEKGFFPMEDLKTLRHIDSYLQGHPNMDTVPGCDMSTGSLGQGISAAVGMAMAGKLDNMQYRVYAVLGDGELEEGQVWEAAMSAAHYKLDNLLTFVDYNGLQIDGNITEVMNPEPIADKFKAFGWNVLAVNAHNFEEIDNAVTQAKQTNNKPTVIIAHSIKGKDVSFMENEASWHGSAPNKEQKEKAIAELDALLKELGV